MQIGERKSAMLAISAASRDFCYVQARRVVGLDVTGSSPGEREASVMLHAVLSDEASAFVQSGLRSWRDAERGRLAYMGSNDRGAELAK